jgi:hypothetical protein
MNDNVTAILNLETGRELHAEGLGYTTVEEWMRPHFGYGFDLDARVRRGYYALLLNPDGVSSVAPYRLTESFRVPVQFGTEWMEVRVYERPR